MEGKLFFFLDEIHRFNKSQQDIFLPYVEKGIITLIGATTENPSFEVNSALLSRCRVFLLNKLSEESLGAILKRALREDKLIQEEEQDSQEENETTQKEKEKKGKKREIEIDDDALKFIAKFANGDARAALNTLEMAIMSLPKPTSSTEKLEKTKQESQKEESQKEELQKEESQKQESQEESQNQQIRITTQLIQQLFQKPQLIYDKHGEEHYNLISALHKSVRGSDVNAALYWLGRQIISGEDPLYLARRLIRMASEDIGMADPQALNLAVNCYQACHFLGYPECDTILAQCVIYLTLAPKSNSIYTAIENVKQFVKTNSNEGVPLHLRNAPTLLMKQFDYKVGYKYNPDFNGDVDQIYLPPNVQGNHFWNFKIYKEKSIP